MTHDVRVPQGHAEKLMKTSSRLVALIMFGIAPWLGATGELIKGLTYYTPKASLTGKLVFHLHHDAENQTNGPAAGAIYEFDLARAQLRKLTDSPSGMLDVSPEGDACCVVYWNVRAQSQATNAFVFCNETKQGHHVRLPGEVQKTEFVGGMLFFQVGATNCARLVEYDIKARKTIPIELPGAKRWGMESYDRIHRPIGKDDMLHFCYSKQGSVVQVGREYDHGCYSLEVPTGKVSLISPLVHNNHDDDADDCKAFNGRFVFLEGPDSPVNEFKLISAPWNDNEHQDKDGRAKAREVKTLATFSHFSALTGGSYSLEQMSPDGRYAFVRFSKGISRKSDELPGTMHTYVIVNVETGQRHLLLKDEVQRETQGFLDTVSWVKSGTTSQ